jgi:hypothetical protein
MPTTITFADSLKEVISWKHNQRGRDERSRAARLPEQREKDRAHREAMKSEQEWRGGTNGMRRGMAMMGGKGCGGMGEYGVQGDGWRRAWRK